MQDKRKAYTSRIEQLCKKHAIDLAKARTPKIYGDLSNDLGDVAMTKYELLEWINTQASRRQRSLEPKAEHLVSQIHWQAYCADEEARCKELGIR